MLLVESNTVLYDTFAITIITIVKKSDLQPTYFLGYFLTPAHVFQRIANGKCSQHSLNRSSANDFLGCMF